MEVDFLFNAEEIQSLNELELSLYNYISKSKDKVIYMRIRDLASEAHVSTTTILRFCHKMRCVGFSEFKVKLKLYLQDQKPIKITDDRTIFLEFMDRVPSPNFQSSLNKACQMIYHASSVIFAGIGSSGILASYGARYFSALDKFSVYIADPFYPIVGRDLENSVSVIFSVSGETIESIRQANMLKNKKSQLISITNSKNCTLANMSDLNISYYVQTIRTIGSDVTTQLPVLYIIETIARKVHNMALSPLP
jgi:DNA-binding MurR/RpiR family transcriptional regulator